MRRGLAIGLLLGWLLGVGSAVLGMAATGGLYEYRWLERADCLADKSEMIARGFEVMPDQRDPCYFRRPRLRFP